jgi:hypothetical protein
MRELELNVNSRLIIFKLFDRYVMSGLGSIYDEVNENLIQAGVLPQIRYALPPGASAITHTPETSRGASAGANTKASIGLSAMITASRTCARNPVSAARSWIGPATQYSAYCPCPSLVA